MDITALNAQKDQLTQQVQADEQALTNDQTALAEVQKKLDKANFVNMLEAFTAEEVAEINSFLAEASNTLGVTLTLPATEIVDPAQA